MSDTGNIGRLVRGRLWFDDGFTQVPNNWLRDKKLSFTARGVLSWMISHDVDFEITIRGISAGTPHGVDAIRSAIRELEFNGYLKRYRRRERGRIVGTDWRLIDPFAPVDNHGSTPLDMEELKPLQRRKPRSAPERDLPDVVEPALVEPARDNPTTKEDQLKEHLTSSSQDQATDRARESGGCHEARSGEHKVITEDRHCVLCGELVEQVAP